MKKLFLVLGWLLLTFFLLGCTEKTEVKVYADFNHMDHWDELNQLTDEETYLYFYSPYCAISKSIETEVSAAFVTLEQNGVPILLISEGMIFEQGTPPLDVIETPSILVYKNKEFQEIISGSKPVLTFLAQKTGDMND